VLSINAIELQGKVSAEILRTFAIVVNLEPGGAIIRKLHAASNSYSSSKPSAPL
jgi:hypothetical protein